MSLNFFSGNTNRLNARIAHLEAELAQCRSSLAVVTLKHKRVDQALMDCQSSVTDASITLIQVGVELDRAALAGTHVQISRLQAIIGASA